jgi:hydroxymethylpyrimidine/phosphomethylpyrimidine kinase
VAEGSVAGDPMAAISADIATLSEVITAGMAVVTAITGTEAVGMVALTTVGDIGMEARIGGVTHSVSGTMTTINNSIRQTTRMTRRLTR